MRGLFHRVPRPVVTVSLPYKIIVDGSVVMILIGNGGIAIASMSLKKHAREQSVMGQRPMARKEHFQFGSVSGEKITVGSQTYYYFTINETGVSVHVQAGLGDSPIDTRVVGLVVSGIALE